MKIVLVQPEIPFNTGAIGRTCVALDLELILIKPYGFSIDEKTVARAGTRYWEHVKLIEYSNWQSFLKHERPSTNRLYFFEEDGDQSFYTPEYKKDSFILENIMASNSVNVKKNYIFCGQTFEITLGSCPNNNFIACLEKRLCNSYSYASVSTCYNHTIFYFRHIDSPTNFLCDYRIQFLRLNFNKTIL